MIEQQIVQVDIVETCEDIVQKAPPIQRIGLYVDTSGWTVQIVCSPRIVQVSGPDCRAALAAACRQVVNIMWPQP